MLKRKQPLKRTHVKNLSARKPLRRVRLSKVATVRKANRERAEFVREFSRCFNCNVGPNVWPPLSCHEIASGPARGKAIQYRAAWLCLCGACHDRLHRENWTVAAQLLLKLRNDPTFYDRDLVNRLRGRAPDAVSESEVEECKWKR